MTIYFSCTMKCFNKFSEQDMQTIVKYINSFDEKTQDVCIENLINVEDVKDKRRTSTEPKNQKRTLLSSLFIRMGSGCQFTKWLLSDYMV